MMDTKQENLEESKLEEHVELHKDAKQVLHTTIPLPPWRFDPFLPWQPLSDSALKQPHTPTGKRGKKKHLRGKKKMKKSKAAVLRNEEIKLHKSDNAWKPSHKRSGEEDDQKQPHVLTGIREKKKKKKSKTAVLQNNEIELHKSDNAWKPSHKRCGEEDDQKQPHRATGKREKNKKEKSETAVLSNEEIKLHESENPWKPSRKVVLSNKDDAEQELIKRIRSILNKLTLRKFGTLVEQVKELPIDTMQKLEGTVSLIFERVINEPLFSILYANMCKKIALMKVPLDGQQGYVKFWKFLLTKCQSELEQDKRVEKKHGDKLKAIIAAEDDEKRKSLQMEFDEEENEIRMRQLSNIRFVGELFKLGMISEPIVHECITNLLTQGDEESLECLCHLLVHIGKELEEKREQSRKYMDSYIFIMEKIVEKRLTSSRMRFLLQDVIDFMRVSSYSITNNLFLIQRFGVVNRNLPLHVLFRSVDLFVPIYVKQPEAIGKKKKGRKKKKSEGRALQNKLIQFHKSENPWEPSHKRSGEEDNGEQELFKKIRGILNKLTPQKFETFVVQMKELPIDTMQRLDGTAYLIFERAINEWFFSALYANMCKELESINVPLDEKQGYVNFRELLLTRCQREFDPGKRLEKKRDKELETSKSENDEEKCKKMQMEFEEEENKIKMRQLENIRFIGQLFQLGMILEPIMHESIEKLLAQNNEDSLEYFCCHLKNISKELKRYEEKDMQSREFMDSYIFIMEKIVDKRTNSRVRFLLQDVIDFMKSI